MLELEARGADDDEHEWDERLERRSLTCTVF